MPRPEDIRGLLRFGSVAGVLLLVIALVTAAVHPYTQWLWFTQDAQRPQAFRIEYAARGSIFLTALIATWAFVWWNLARALRTALVYVHKPTGLGVMAANLIHTITERGPGLVRVLSFLIAFVFAARVSADWPKWLLFQHSVPFGKSDPLFGLDYAFFVFRLPWLGTLTAYLATVAVFTLAVTFAIYAGLRALAAIAAIELSAPQIRVHLSVLSSLGFLVWAVRVWLGSYDFAFVDGASFTGAGYAQSQLPMLQRVLAVLLLVSAVATLIGGFRGEPFRYLKFSLAASAIWAFLALAIYPSTLQRFVVDPNRLAREAPFAERAIAATRYAYGLDNIRVHELEVQPRPSPADVAVSEPTLQNMRLWDPTVLQQSLEGLQSLRAYYKFNDVDIDRYLVNGRPQLAMVAARDVNLRGLPENARNWTNLRLRYTHGYGITMSLVDAATPDGDPDFLISDVPLKKAPGFRVDRPQLYFSDFRDPFGRTESEYALVAADEKELDYETGSTTVTHAWTAGRGVRISEFLPRLAFSLALGDGNLLVSSNIQPGTRLLANRNVIDRAQAIYPFLRFDLDPYLVLLDGRLIWVLDAYTTTDRLPYSQRIGQGPNALNYIRNSVKVTVDAYSGETHAYVLQPDEPLLKAYGAMYPELLESAEAIPVGMREHFRYPEDMFRLQTEVWCSYHVDDPRRFLSNSDAWNIANERTPMGNSEAIEPYYVIMRLPIENQNGFYLIRPFTPNGKPNMSGWMAAHGDPATYGQLTLYRFRGDLPAGPELMESKFNANQELANINRQFNNDQSEIVVGNSLVIPIGDSVMYAESLFLRSKTLGIQATPRLTKVILALADRIVVRDTYAEALAALLGDDAAPRPVPSTGPLDTPPATSATLAPVVKQALNLLDEADAAMRAGDLGRYGDLNRRAREILRSAKLPN